MSNKSIICTLGPASLQGHIIKRLTELGVDLFRINLSHAPVQEIDELVNLIRQHSEVAICLDTQGAQARTGTFAGGAAQLKFGSIVELVAPAHQGDTTVVPLYPESVLPQLEIDDLLKIDFGTALLQVVETGSSYRARVVSSGAIGSNKAVTAVDRSLSLPPITDVDHAAIEIGLRLNISSVALSFTSSRLDVEMMRELVGEGIRIICKIESRLGVQNLTSILDVADAILIDRGDLSREIPLETLPFVQKDIVRQANQAHVPVYVATNLLESMVTSLRPTRAEVNDVVNTLIDGADGLVLAAETTIGKHPVESVRLARVLINEFESRYSKPANPTPETRSSQLTLPHGGELIERVLTERDVEAVEELPRVQVDEQTMMDARQIATGAYSPLQGFMGLEALEGVLARNRLPDGAVWTMPVLFQLKTGGTFPYGPGENVTLGVGRAAEALFHIEEVFDYGLNELAEKWYGTSDSAHPGVRWLCSGSERFVAGKVDLLASALRHPLPYELTPRQVRSIFTHLRWQKIVGFHTRNVAHRAHEYLQLTALENRHCDGVFIHPIVGPKKSGDFTRSIIIKTYEHLLQNFYPSDKAVLGGFASYSRYAGPREALFTALCRKNFGCSHFIIGRDHTGVDGYYSPLASQRLLDEVGGIGIEPVIFDEVYHCEQCGEHIESCRHGLEYARKISGTAARDALMRGEPLPDWHMREPLSRLILEEIRNGGDVFVA